MRSTVLLILLVILTLAGESQTRKDSLRQQLARDSAHIFRATFAKPYLRLENRNSFISREYVNLLGFMVGVTLVDRHTISAGYYFLDTRREHAIRIKYKNVQATNYVSLFYFPVDYQFVAFNRRFVQLNLPVGIGYGAYDLRITNSLNEEIGTEHGYIWPVNTGAQLILKPLRWLGLSGTGGYRFVGQPKDIDLSLKGWYYSFGVWVDARQILRYIRYYHKKRTYRKIMRHMD